MVIFTLGYTIGAHSCLDSIETRKRSVKDALQENVQQTNIADGKEWEFHAHLGMMHITSGLAVSASSPCQLKDHCTLANGTMVAAVTAGVLLLSHSLMSRYFN